MYMNMQRIQNFQNNLGKKKSKKAKSLVLMTSRLTVSYTDQDSMALS